MTALDQLFIKVRAENRAALIAYIPAGFPSQAGCHRVIAAFIAGGVDAIEIGYPYSDPVMDGPTIQAAAVTSLANGTGAEEVLEALKIASASVPAVVMTYWNPIERYGVDNFAAAISANGGSGVITPDLTIEESVGWINATSNSTINPIYVVAPSTKDARLAKVTSKCGGFVYAASLMGVTGARTSVSSGAADLVARVRKTTDLPIAVGLGVSTREQAKDVAAYADGVIVGSELARELAKGVREGR
jgi:tryptophan synthase alpha chain